MSRSTSATPILTMHLGFVTRETHEIFYGDAVEDVKACQSGEPIRVMA